METFLRDWRQDALNKAQYESAIFIGDKLLALTGDDKDAFWLAQVHFAMGNYTRAQALLSKSDLIARNASCRYLAAHCLIKQSRFDDALAVLGERNPTHLIPTSANKRKATGGGPGAAGAASGGPGGGSVGPANSSGRIGGSGHGGNSGSGSGTAHANTSHLHGSRKVGFAGSRSLSKSGRGAAAAAAVSSSSSAAATTAAGPGSRAMTGGPSVDIESAASIAAEAAAAEAAAAEASNRRYEAGMCYLRGICYAKQNVFDRAKECYKDAVRIDVQCFEAFQQLTKNALMAPEEEWDFLQSLDFDSIGSSSSLGPATDEEGNSTDTAQEAADFTRMLYSTRLSKYRNPEAFATAAECLATHYRLGNNADLLLARADLAYTQCRYEDALALTSTVLEEDRYNFGAYPLHLACLFELRLKNVLFLVAHDLADQHPEEPCTWLAVGVYYFATDRIAEARRYFSKASMMDAHYGPAWIGFAHTFAAEGEHDQAISAYSTAARLFTGTHLPQVFLGMQHHAMNNMAVAEEFLRTAYGLCREDPLLLNEMGVVCYHQDRPKDAATLFRKALEVADDMDCDPQAWLSARTNLGHAFRRMRLFREALAQFDEVLRLGGKNAPVFCAKGLIHLERGRPDEAVVVLHEALAVRPQDPIATELLNTALAEMTASRHVLQLPGSGLDGSSEGPPAFPSFSFPPAGRDMEVADADDYVNPAFEHDLLQRRRDAHSHLAEAVQAGAPSTQARLLRQKKLAASLKKGKGKNHADDPFQEADDGAGGDDNGISRQRLRKMVRNPYMAQLQRQMQMQNLGGGSGSGAGAGAGGGHIMEEGDRAQQ